MFINIKHKKNLHICITAWREAFYNNKRIILNACNSHFGL